MTDPFIESKLHIPENLKEKLKSSIYESLLVKNLDIVTLNYGTVLI
jgi:hypothetical protein